MKLFFALLVLVSSLSVFASDFELNKDEGFTIEINGCESYERPELEVDKDRVIARCVPITCHTQYDRKSKMYKVYRCENDAYSFYDCDGAKEVGAFLRKTSFAEIFLYEKKVIRGQLENFIANDRNCGLISHYIDDYKGRVVVKRVVD